jgi:hypothetical protein
VGEAARAGRGRAAGDGGVVGVPVPRTRRHRRPRWSEEQARCWCMILATSEPRTWTSREPPCRLSKPCAGWRRMRRAAFAARLGIACSSRPQRR